MIKAALFDLDGVVINTEPLYTKFWGEQFQLYFPGSSGLEQEIKGMTLVQIYDHYFADRPEQQMAITKRLNAFEAEMEMAYIPGFEDFINKLRHNNLLTAVVTSSNREKMTSVYRNHPGFQEQFTAILTSEDFDKSKPDPDGYLKAAAHLGVKPEECLGFEDSFNGLKALRAAGTVVIGLSTTNAADAIQPLCDKVVPDFTALQLSDLL